MQAPALPVGARFIVPSNAGGRVPHTSGLRVGFLDGRMPKGLPRYWRRSACSDVWQPRFRDFNVYSARKVRERLESLYTNPAKPGPVKRPGEWV